LRFEAKPFLPPTSNLQPPTSPQIAEKFYSKTLKLITGQRLLRFLILKETPMTPIFAIHCGLEDRLPTGGHHQPADTGSRIDLEQPDELLTTGATLISLKDSDATQP
jgi:hypothetical protein